MTTSRIFPFLYLGCHHHTKDKKQLINQKITHIIVLGDNVREAFKKAESQNNLDFVYKVIDIEDKPNQNIKQYFKETHDFIIGGKKEGYVLVICPTGNSRAATICISYLIKTLNLTVQDAYDLVKECRNSISPNEGFVTQLHEYYNELHPETLVVSEIQNPVVIQDSPTEKSEKLNNQSEQSENTNQSEESEIQTEISDSQKIYVRYTCKWCRTPLFTNLDILPHQVGQGQTSFKWAKRDPTVGVLCSSYFLDEMEWMGNCNENTGKLFCPNCKNRIGTWHWSGTQCSCGAWCTPAFQISKARVDAKDTEFILEMKT